MKNLLLAITVGCILSGCASKLKPFSYPNPVDTSTREIQYQEKKIFSTDSQGVFARNDFDGARLNAFEHQGEERYRATILPENKPINPSPYYAFKLWAPAEKEIELELFYDGARHRYWPKLSADGTNWSWIDSSAVAYDADSMNVSLKLSIGPDTLWVAAQEIKNSTHVRDWCKVQAEHADVDFFVAGKSKMGRDMYMLDIGEGDPMDKPAVMIISRQHPPEVTGYLAMEAFVEEILEDNPLANDFREKFRLLVFPLMNPDGVDLGHWRHNTGGIDLNRDWAMYNQEEIQVVAGKMISETNASKNEVLLGLDFHSTYYDVFYTTDYTKIPTVIYKFKDYWLFGIKQAIEGYEPRDAPSGLGAPVSKGWFYQAFQAEGVTYEIGDDTPRDFIKRKSVVAAQEMMKLLIYRE